MDVGDVLGTEVGTELGRLVGSSVGRLEEGCLVGRLVSPGLVGFEVTGAFVGEEVGTLVVGVDVGASTLIAWPMTMSTFLIEPMDAFASGVSRTGTPRSFAAAKSSFANTPEAIDVLTLAAI
jgi:hypothetical protein